MTTPFGPCLIGCENHDTHSCTAFIEGQHDERRLNARWLREQAERAYREADEMAATDAELGPSFARKAQGRALERAARRFERALPEAKANVVRIGVDR